MPEPAVVEAMDGLLRQMTGHYGAMPDVDVGGSMGNDSTLPTDDDDLLAPPEDDDQSQETPDHDGTVSPKTAEDWFVPPANFGQDYLEKGVNSEDCISHAFNNYHRFLNREKSMIHLLHILKGQPLKLFDEIMEWRHTCLEEYGDELLHGQKPPKRDKAIALAKQHYGYKALEHKLVPVKLPATGAEIDLVVFPFGQMMASLLADPVVMQWSNLTIDPLDPFRKPRAAGKDEELNDFNTGTVHETAHRIYCKDESKDILNEITLFIDQSHLDHKGKHTLEPVCFTMGIFNQKFRTNPKAWRTIGYLPNMSQVAPHATPDEKLRDWHHCLRILLSEFVEHQKLGGIDWTLHCEDEEKGIMKNIKC